VLNNLLSCIGRSDEKKQECWWSCVSTCDGNTLHVWLSLNIYLLFWLQ
jgi:hypothetical protein